MVGRSGEAVLGSGVAAAGGSRVAARGSKAVDMAVAAAAGEGGSGGRRAWWAYDGFGGLIPFFCFSEASMQPSLKMLRLQRRSLRDGCACPPLKMFLNRLGKDYCSSATSIAPVGSLQSLWI